MEGHKYSNNFTNKYFNERSQLQQINKKTLPPVAEKPSIKNTYKEHLVQFIFMFKIFD